jgi:hypothetical protein
MSNKYILLCEYVYVQLYYTVSVQSNELQHCKKEHIICIFLNLNIWSYDLCVQCVFWNHHTLTLTLTLTLTQARTSTAATSSFKTHSE